MGKPDVGYLIRLLWTAEYNRDRGYLDVACNDVRRVLHIAPDLPWWTRRAVRRVLVDLKHLPKARRALARLMDRAK